MPRDTYSRAEIIAALRLRPCHVTGEHNPTHTPEFICRFQLHEALSNLLLMLQVGDETLPRRLHEDCYFCDTDGRPHGTEHAERHAALRAWADGAPLRLRS